MWLSQEEFYRLKAGFLFILTIGTFLFIFSQEIIKAELLTKEIFYYLEVSMYTIIIVYTIIFNFMLFYNRRLIRMYKFRINSYYTGSYISWYIEHFISLEKQANVIMDKQKLDYFMYFLEKYKEIEIKNPYYSKKILHIIYTIYQEHLNKNKNKNKNRHYYNNFLKMIINDLEWFIIYDYRGFSKEENEKKFDSFMEGIYTKYSGLEESSKKKSILEMFIV